MRGDDNVGGLMAALHVAGQRLDRRAGAAGADSADRLCKVFRAAVRQIVPRGAGQNDMAKPQLFGRLRHVFRLVRVGRQGLAAGDVAEPAAARADVAEEHKRGCVLLIAFAEIRTVGRLADGIELQIAHQFRDLAHGLLVIADAEPFGFAFHGPPLPFLRFDDRDGRQHRDAVAFLAQLAAQDAVFRRFDLVDDLIGLDLVQSLALVDLLPLVFQPGAQNAALHLRLELRHNKLFFHRFSSVRFT